MEFTGEVLQAAERDVAFSSFQRTEIGAVQMQGFGEGLLGESAGVPDRSEVAPEPALKDTLHATVYGGRMLLVGLQTYK